MNTFKWLLKREYWEHKGGFFWAPAVASLIFLVLGALAIVGIESARRAMHEPHDLQFNGVPLERLTEVMTARELAEFAGALDFGSFIAAAWPMVVLAFVVFFYCLGALYDDRKDRSFLFWKSLPLSDAKTVGSKVASALVVAPLFAVAASFVTIVFFLSLLSVYAIYHGGNPFTLVWGPASPLTVSMHLLATLPVYAIWALPTVGWLLLVSAWAKSKPFLWATLVPVFAGIMVTWFDAMGLFGVKAEWFWANIVGRILGGTVPGIDFAYRASSDPMLQNFNPDGPQDLAALFSAQLSWQTLATSDAWIGAAAGIAMVFGAIWFRKIRDEG